MTGDTITSTEIGDLLGELNIAIDAALKMATITKEQAFDPLRQPDPHVARQDWEDTEFLANRLATLLPRLQARLDQVRSEEMVKQSALHYCPNLKPSRRKSRQSLATAPPD